MLKVHGSDFEFCIISLLVMLKYEGFVKKMFSSGHYWGDTIIPLSLRLRGIKFDIFFFFFIFLAG
jgi:hypothetical protein